jgi:threonine dehydrogenase-like Zn-dependent dehydrogenase
VVARTPPPNPASTLLERCGARYASTRERQVPALAESLPPLDLIVEATGASELVFEAMRILGSNGVLILLGVGRGSAVAPVPTDEINRGFVGGNKLMFGSVNSAREDFVAGVADLARFEERWPGLTAGLITHRLRAFDDIARVGERIDNGIKTVIEFAES